MMTEGAQVLQANKGEQLPLSSCSSSCPASVAETSSAHPSAQQGTNVPVAVMNNNIMTNHFFKGLKVIKYSISPQAVCIPEFMPLLQSCR
jgi:hypothetical protein